MEKKYMNMTISNMKVFFPNMVAVALQFINLGAFPNENIILGDFLLEL